MSRTNETLIQALKESGALKTAAVEDALRAVDRADFVPEELRADAYLDTALPIGYGQTISQPTVVAFCLEQLAVAHGMRVLDVGSGSGYTTALLSQLVGPAGEVVGVETIPELVAFGQENLAKYAPTNARIEAAGAALGKPSAAPFDRILVSAAAEEMPAALKEQIADGGRIVLPVQQSICVVDRQGDFFPFQCHEGYVFVPLVT
ncbi:MAG TPA: protein-L-isoaspartate O-methyltransferase [Candidatus Paceibacterota bacterium]